MIHYVKSERIGTLLIGVTFRKISNGVLTKLNKLVIHISRNESSYFLVAYLAINMALEFRVGEFCFLLTNFGDCL